MRRLICVLVAVAGLLGGVLPARAATPEDAVTNPLKNVVLMTGHNGSGNGTATAWCDPGKVVLGGGMRTTSGTMSQRTFNLFKPVMHVSSTGVVRYGFFVAASDATAHTPPADLFSAAAVCADPLPGWEIVSKTTITALVPEHVESVTCPVGKVVLGGGAQAVGGATLDEVLPGTNTVSTKAFRAGPSAWSLTAYAICAFPVLGRVVVNEGVGEARPDGTAKARSAYPLGTITLSGAFDLVTSLGTVGMYSVWPEPIGASSSIAVGAVEYDDGTENAWKTAAYAVCAQY